MIAVIKEKRVLTEMKLVKSAWFYQKKFNW